MERTTQEKDLFEKTLKTVNKILSVTGLQLDENDIQRTLLQRFLCRPYFIFNSVLFFISMILAVGWLVNSILIHRSVTEITYYMPCLSLCLLGILKVFSFINNGHHVNDIVISLRKLQAVSYARRRYRDEVEEDLLKNKMPILNGAIHLILFFDACGLTSFCIEPFILTALKYSATGQLELMLPFLVWYPFNAVDVKVWPFTYVHQVWSGVITAFCVLGPDSFFLFSCTFIHVQFKSLQYDIQRIRVRTLKSDRTESEAFDSVFKELIERHLELIRCVDLLEKIYTKSTLFNVVSSSLIICATGFNVTTIDNFVLMAPFVSFLSMGLCQIFIFCYCGDVLVQSSFGVGNAVQNSDWYRADVKTAKSLLLMLIRSQKPCKLTACGYVDINMNTFCRIMSTAMSYFTLLETAYKQ